MLCIFLCCIEYICRQLSGVRNLKMDKKFIDREISDIKFTLCRGRFSIFTAIVF